MASAAIGTIAIATILVLGTAVWLISMAVSLQQITGELDTILGMVTGIAGQVKPAPEVVGAIARDVGAIQGALHGLISLATSGGPAPARAAATRAAAAPAPPRAAAAPAPARAAAAAAPAPAPAAGPARREATQTFAEPETRSGPQTPPPVHRRRY
ncbi:MAG TPA: hypothetical protein VHT75_00365 [Acidimicrobiales bacterium]|jgi:hypothetical protein|nr:hypothetical protein [Acidimicrobiales bacterium]